jgi:hypothetical protein
MRVYVPATTVVLRQLVDEGGLTGPLTAFAVTPALREAYAHADQEELEYAATMDAARASLRLLAEEPEAAPRRVVVAADVPDTAGIPDAVLGRSAVQLSVPVPLDRVASVHIDEAAAEETVRDAVRALGAADAGDEDAQFRVSEVEGYDLLWYATQEVTDLLNELDKREH